jgi:hypothetical protein
MNAATTLPPWTWNIPARLNAAAACTDAHAAGPAADRPAVICGR